MYYNSNNAVMNQPMVWNIDENKVKSVVAYVMNGLYDKLKNFFATESEVKESIVGYNSENYKQIEKIYSMAYTSVNILENNYIKANTTLDEIAKLKDDWNNNGASSFPAKMVAKCRGIVTQLAAEPFICPTACGSIQFEYEKENGDYLEFEVYEDRIEVYLDTASDGAQEFNLRGISATDRMKQLVVDFYG